MKDLLLVIASWFHLIATITWIGGMGFVLFIAIPSSRKVMGADSGKLMAEITKRFTPLANYSIALLLVTGSALAVLNDRFSSSEILENHWIIVLAAKHALVFSMIAIHFYRGWILAPKIMRTESNPRRVSFQKLSINLVKANFSLGLIVLFLSGTISGV